MLKQIVSVALIMLVFTGVSNAQRWDFDKPHSSIGFSVKHLVITKVNGKFDDYSGYVVFNENNLENAKVEITIDIATINTDNQKRDNHLKSGDFFDIEKYPSMTFKSKTVKKGNSGKFEIVGDLTIKDVTKEVVLDVGFNGTIIGPMGKSRAGFTARTKINRQDFNVAWNNKLKDGSLIVGNDIEINLEVELIKTEKVARN